MIRVHTILVPVLGSAGSATGSAKSRDTIMGCIKSVYIDYTSQPGTADVTIATTGSNYPARTLITRTNSGTDGWFDPRIQATDTSATAIAWYDEIYLSDQVTASVAQGDAGAVTVYLIVESD